MKLRFDEKRACALFEILTDLWTRKIGVFQNIVLPQNRVELPGEPRDKANLLLFAAITQRGGIVSEDPFKYLESLADTHPSLFDPFGVLLHWDVYSIMNELQRTVIERKF